MNKRGFAITFKWILALIAGLIIFLFIINFAYKHIFISESKTSIAVLSNIESQLDSLSIAEDLETQLEVKEINFACNLISIDSTKTSTNKIIFSPNKLKNKLNIWTKTWKYPFPITNFYYISNKNYFLFDPPYELEFPSIFNIRSYPDYVPNDAILIFFYQPSQSELNKYKDHKIKIIQDNQVTFYPRKTTTYYGQEMLLGAIFTDDYVKFKCLKNKALNKLIIIAQVYQKKAQTLAQINCKDKYQLIINLLENFKTNPINPEAIKNLDLDIEQNGCTPLFN